ncbi:putative F-box domain, leucine-rich repeat domain, L domain-containing protein [Rosa chinensis]|uniref:Putative F-box domain, leucine-rich repeat domain, L domain-containing protein n=1 Tax=Rosa chinensis TaxID=74649 RepID=A0A2P6SJD7_ROSCH|nr:uncharacterized protein LOC112169876 [Rosa chinensis]PRQ58789.1 putative F-box domain, leucine-rich repeat domain, L domain-containing protein [Rosa chinensis]
MDHHLVNLSGAVRRTSDRTWEDLPKDCLLNILERVGTESLLMFVPLVCKSWYRASLSSSCWKRLFFPAEIEKGTVIYPWSFPVSTSDDDDQSTSFDYVIRRYAKEFGIEWSRFYVSKFIKFAVNRSQGETQFLKVPGICSHYMNAMREILEHIGRNCRGFEGLHISHALVDVDLAKDIVKYVPQIKYLCLKKAKIGRIELIVLIKGCRELKVLDVRDCLGFTEGDREIAELGSHIGEFMMEGSRQFRRRDWVEVAGVVQVDED